MRLAAAGNTTEGVGRPLQYLTQFVGPAVVDGGGGDRSQSAQIGKVRFRPLRITTSSLPSAVEFGCGLWHGQGSLCALSSPALPDLFHLSEGRQEAAGWRPPCASTGLSLSVSSLLGCTDGLSVPALSLV